MGVKYLNGTQCKVPRLFLCCLLWHERRSYRVIWLMTDAWMSRRCIQLDSWQASHQFCLDVESDKHNTGMYLPGIHWSWPKETLDAAAFTCHCSSTLPLYVHLSFLYLFEGLRSVQSLNSLFSVTFYSSFRSRCSKTDSAHLCSRDARFQDAPLLA